MLPWEPLFAFERAGDVIEARVNKCKLDPFTSALCRTASLPPRRGSPLALHRGKQENFQLSISPRRVYV